MKFNSTFKRKTSTLSCWDFSVQNQVNSSIKRMINDQSLTDWFKYKDTWYLMRIYNLFTYLKIDLTRVNFFIRVWGGGRSSQSELILWAIIKLLFQNVVSRHQLKKDDVKMYQYVWYFLKNDVWKVEWKKPGRWKSWRSVQFSKR